MGSKRLSLRKEGDYWVVSRPNKKDLRFQKKSSAKECYDANLRVNKKRAKRKRRKRRS